MDRKEKVSKLQEEVNQATDTETLWNIAKQFSELKAWSDYSKTIQKIFEIDPDWEMKP